MKVEAMMQRAVRTCAPNDTLRRAAQLMWNGDCGCLPVVDESGALVGMITDRDVCMGAYTSGASLERCTVAETMSKRVFACRVQDTVREAEAVMRAHRVRRLPVVDANDRLIGILSLNDIARQAERAVHGNGAAHVDAAEVALTLGAICQPHAPRAM